MNATHLDELYDLLRIPSVSADPNHAADVRRAGEWVRDLVRSAKGGEAELVETDAQPMVIGEIPASNDPGNAPTVLVYGHFDVQPPAPIELWDSDPFEPTVQGRLALRARRRRRQGSALLDAARRGRPRGRRRACR